MDLHSYFEVASSSKSLSASVGSGEVDSQSFDVESLEPHPPKKHCSAKSKEISTQRKYNKKWEKDFLWLEYDHNYHGAFCKVCRKQEPQSLQKTRGTWITKPFKNWKRAVEKMRTHSKSDSHIKSRVISSKSKERGIFLLYSNYTLLESKSG